MNEKSNELVRREIITGSRRFSNYLLTIVLTLGGIGFVLSGCSSYFKINLLPFADPTQLTFIPQGIIMLFLWCCRFDNKYLYYPNNNLGYW